MSEKTVLKDKIKDLLKINKKYLVLILTVIAIIAVGLSIYFVMRNIEYKKYEHYEEKMNAYGFNRLYDNGLAKTNQKVTKAEAIKIVVGTCLNTFDIEGIAKKPTDDYKDAIWVLYAQDMELAKSSDLNKETANKKAKYIDVINYFSNAKEKLLRKKLDNTTDKKLTDLEKYSENEQEAILDMLANDILKVVDNKLKGNKNIFKGQLNEIVVNYVEKYDLFDDKIQTDVSKLPSNASEYAYISTDVAKEVYEMPFEVDVEGETKSPKDCFSDIKPYYEQIIHKIEKYYNTLVNVDYQTTTAESLKNDLHHLLIMSPTDVDLNKYVDYIKTNQIKLSGEAKVQKPIIYYNGSNYKVRTKIDFKVESSNTTDNLLFGDFGITDMIPDVDFEGDGEENSTSSNIIRYENKENSIIVDVNMKSVFGSETFYLSNYTLNVLLGNDNKYKIYNPNTMNGFEDINIIQ